jgi:hypothetical protein
MMPPTAVPKPTERDGLSQCVDCHFKNRAHTRRVATSIRLALQSSNNLATSGETEDERAEHRADGETDVEVSTERREAIREYSRLVRRYESMLTRGRSGRRAVAPTADSSERSRNDRFGISASDFATDPAPEMRGDIARILFHMSLRDGFGIPRDLEGELRQWHVDDPVDEGERARDALLDDLPIGANPYIGYPWLVDLVEDF